jgi:hypothetical protein
VGLSSHLKQEAFTEKLRVPVVERAWIWNSWTEELVVIRFETKGVVDGIVVKAFEVME